MVMPRVRNIKCSLFEAAMNTASTFQKIVNAHVTPYLFGFLGWQLMWQLQTQLAVLDYALGISLMFLPAGIRTLAVLIFGLRGAVGVFVGAVFSTIEYLGHIPTMDLANVVLIAAISAFSAYLMMQLVCWWRRIGVDLEELRFSDVLVIVFSQGLLSATLHQWVYRHHELEEIYIKPSLAESFRLWAAMATGDIVGSMVLMLSGVMLANFLRRLHPA